jgi:hypothetical protein
MRQCRKIGEHVRNRGKAAPETEENQHREKQLQSGQAPTWSNGWIEDQPRLIQGESGQT